MAAERELSFKERRSLKTRSQYLEGILAGHTSSLYDYSSEGNITLLSWTTKDWTPGLKPTTDKQFGYHNKTYMDIGPASGTNNHIFAYGLGNQDMSAESFTYNMDGNNLDNHDVPRGLHEEQVNVGLDQEEEVEVMRSRSSSSSSFCSSSSSSDGGNDKKKRGM